MKQGKAISLSIFCKIVFWFISHNIAHIFVTRKVTRGGVNRPSRGLLSGLKILVPFLLWLLTKTHHILLYLPRHSNTRPPLLALVSNYYCYTWRRRWFNEPRSCLYCFVFVFIVNIFHLVSLYFFLSISRPLSFVGWRGHFPYVVLFLSYVPLLCNLVIIEVNCDNFLCVFVFWI